jgi:hypothetical protein
MFHTHILTKTVLLVKLKKHKTERKSLQSTQCVFDLENDSFPTKLLGFIRRFCPPPAPGERDSLCDTPIPRFDPRSYA